MAASNKTLGLLHEAVAESLQADLAAAKAIEDPAARIFAVKEVRAQIITFLKNNSITGSIEEDDKLATLRERLRAREVGKQSLLQAAEQFGEQHAKLMQ